MIFICECKTKIQTFVFTLKHRNSKTTKGNILCVCTTQRAEIETRFRKLKQKDNEKRNEDTKRNLYNSAPEHHSKMRIDWKERKKLFFFMSFSDILLQFEIFLPHLEQ